MEESDKVEDKVIGTQVEKESSIEAMETGRSGQIPHEERESNPPPPTSPGSSSSCHLPARSSSQGLPDFMNALNMQPVSKCEDSANEDKLADAEEGGLKIDEGGQEVEGGLGEQGGARKVQSLGPGSKEILIDKFKRGKCVSD